MKTLNSMFLFKPTASALKCQSSNSLSILFNRSLMKEHINDLMELLNHLKAEIKQDFIVDFIHFNNNRMSTGDTSDKKGTNDTAKGDKTNPKY